MRQQSVDFEATEMAAARYYEGGMSRPMICRTLKLKPETLDFIIAKYEGRITAYREAVSGRPLLPRRWVS